jgi:hypothetical protein
MYTVDDLDSIIELRDVPQSSVGAPCPMILCSEQSLHLAYFREFPNGDEDIKSVQPGGEYAKDDASLLVKFQDYYAYMFGPPNDEAFDGSSVSCSRPEPLRGLRGDELLVDSRTGENESGSSVSQTGEIPVSSTLHIHIS